MDKTNMKLYRRDKAYREVCLREEVDILKLGPTSFLEFSHNLNVQVFYEN